MSSRFKYIAICACFCSCMTGVQAFSAQLGENSQLDAPERKLFKDPLGGIVVNRTVTVLGNDFYQYFATAWRELDGDTKYAISVHERPSARWGSEIWVQFRQNRVFHTFLSPARQAARAVSERAAEIAYKNITDSEVERLLFQSEDLGKEEL
jgi:curli production assembly/transport component CsgE